MELTLVEHDAGSNPACCIRSKKAADHTARPLDTISIGDHVSRLTPVCQGSGKVSDDKCKSPA